MGRFELKIVFTCLGLLLFFVNTHGKSFLTDPREKNSIKLAFNKCSTGDTIIILPGTYYDSEIVINKQVYITGKNFPVIDGRQKNQLFIVNADHVTITGLLIQNTGKSSMTDIAGIKVVQSSHVRITGNKFLNTTYAVYLQNVDSCFVNKNEIFGNALDELNSGNGVHAWKSSHLEISNNHISGHRDGIYFEFVSHSIIFNNVSEKNMRYGLHFMFSSDDLYKENTFNSNGAGVAVMYSNRVEMISNTFEHNWGEAAYAILLKEINDSRIINNRFIKNTVGIYMEGTNRIQTRNNTFTSNGWAMRIQASCNENVFEHNNFIGNSFDVSTNGTMVLNLFNNNYWDKYDGYDLNHDGVGDIPYYPVSLYSIIIEKIPLAMILYRSLLTDILDQVEKLMPTLIPDHLKDNRPLIRKLDL
jgi:nitrous oxidase accessory protein